MSQTHIPAAVRREVRERADSRCEYCLVPESIDFSGFCIDHVIAEKHDGPTVSMNLAYSCSVCNLNKGSDLGSLDPLTGELIRLFNPRTDAWADHFRLAGPLLVPLSAVGLVTIRLLKLNSESRLREREQLIDLGLLPAGTAPAS